MNPSQQNQAFHYAFLALSIFVFGLLASLIETGLSSWLMLLMGMLMGAFIYITAHFVSTLLGKGLNKIPFAIGTSIIAAIVTLNFSKALGLRLPDLHFYLGLLVLILLVLILALSIVQFRKASSTWNIAGMLFPLAIFAWGITWLMGAGADPFADELPLPAVPENTLTLASQGISSPATTGPFAVDTFTYGSGTDKQRLEYNSKVRWITPTVDASLLLPEWTGSKKKWRERYWGFGVDSFPLNGRVYYPQGEGPFPIALIVHGNHGMVDYSDGGYGYLGHLLASRGIIAVSVDENFINSHWSGDFRGKEMPTRAWLLLKHLEQWKQWNEASDHESYKQVDMDHIMLVGHSRGGEAVSIAAVFDRLSAYPDNGLEKFDFNFGIKGVVSIAPTDYRYHRQMDLENLNYLSLQGSYDADEVSFWGLRPYRRLEFTDATDWFKAGVYIHRANHGQFNSTWGRTDFGAPMSWWLNTQPLLHGEEQRQAAAVFISAFAEAALKENREYLSLFDNINPAREWLPENYYLTHFQQKGDRILQDYSEDIDLGLGDNGIRIRGENFTIWREENLSTRDGSSQENDALVLGWDYGETISKDSVAMYTLELSNPLQLNSANQFLITLGAGDHKALAKLAKDDEENDTLADRSVPELDFQLRLTDTTGARIQQRIGKVKPIAPPLKVQFMKLSSLSKDQIGDDWEVALETFALPLSGFSGDTMRFDPQQIRSIELVFDSCPYGVIIIDEIGVR